MFPFTETSLCNFAHKYRIQMIKCFSIIILLASVCPAYSQYYYKDIISNKQARADMKGYRENKVKQIKIKSFEDDGSLSEGFFCERKIGKDYLSSELFTRTSVSPASLVTNKFNTEGYILSTIDSSEISTTRIDYSYDEDGRLLKIVSTIRSSDDDFVTELREEHLYEYSSDFLPDKMYRIMNYKDTIPILFSKDESGNISIEKDTKSGNKYFYYYDEKSRLTDIVHRSEFKEQLVPDYMFEYDANGNISQMVSTEEGGSYYYIWKYHYQKGMKKKEECYSKDRRLLGYVEYDYK